MVGAHAIEELVVGLPLDASGGEGSQATLTRTWATAVAADLGLPLTFRDERLTSHLAEDRLGPMKRGRSGGPPTQDPSATPTGRASIERRPPSSSRMSSTHGPGCDRPCRDPRPHGEPRMTIRSGGRPRDGRAPHAHPYDPDAYATDIAPDVSEPMPAHGGGRNGARRWRRRARRVHQVPACSRWSWRRSSSSSRSRPCGRSSTAPILGWAADNPARPRAAVRERHRPRGPRRRPDHAGLRPTPRRSSSSSQEGDTASTIAARLEEEGLLGDRGRSCSSPVDRDLTASLQQGTFILRKNMTPDQLVTRAARPAGRPVRRHRPADRACASSRSPRSSRRCR